VVRVLLFRYLSFVSWFDVSVQYLGPRDRIRRTLVKWGVSINRTSDMQLDRRVFSNHRPSLRLGSVLVGMREDAELLDPPI
jgi:hypothetical protein